MADYTNKFTVINRKSKAKEIGRVTERNTLKAPTFRKSTKNLRTYNKETGVFKNESKVRDIIKEKGGVASKEVVSGATFMWEIEFNGEYQMVKDVVTQKEMESIFAITNIYKTSLIYPP